MEILIDVVVAVVGIYVVYNIADMFIYSMKDSKIKNVQKRSGKRGMR